MESQEKTVVAATALLVLAVLVFGVLLSDYAELETDMVLAWFDDMTSLSVPGFVGLQVAQVVFAPIPGTVIGVAGGYLFGFFWGLTYTMIGTVAGSLIVFWLARGFGRTLLERFFAPRRVEKWDAFTERYGVTAFFLMILLPGFPDNLLCFVAGLTDMSPAEYLTSVVLGRLPLFALYVWAGANTGQLWTVEGAALFGLATVVTGALFFKRYQVLRWFGVQKP